MAVGARKKTRTPCQQGDADAGKSFGRRSGRTNVGLRSYLQLSGRVWQLSICPSGFLNVYCAGTATICFAASAVL